MIINRGAVGIAVLAGYMAFRVRRARAPLELKRRFLAAGTLRGRRRTEVIGLVGRPCAVSAAPFAGTLLRWTKASSTRVYEVVLMFDAEGVCLGVADEIDGTRELLDLAQRKMVIPAM